eukprot:5115173-Amphidinium_carterae.1
MLPVLHVKRSGKQRRAKVYHASNRYNKTSVDVHRQCHAMSLFGSLPAFKRGCKKVQGSLPVHYWDLHGCLLLTESRPGPTTCAALDMRKRLPQ